MEMSRFPVYFVVYLDKILVYLRIATNGYDHFV